MKKASNKCTERFGLYVMTKYYKVESYGLHGQHPPHCALTTIRVWHPIENGSEAKAYEVYGCDDRIATSALAS